MAADGTELRSMLVCVLACKVRLRLGMEISFLLVKGNELRVLKNTDIYAKI